MIFIFALPITSAESPHGFFCTSTLISNHYQTPVAFDISVTVKRGKNIQYAFSYIYYYYLQFCNFAIWNIPNCISIVRWDPSSCPLYSKGRRAMHEGQEGLDGEP